MDKEEKKMNIKTFEKAYKYFTGKNVAVILPFIKGKLDNDSFDWFRVGYEYYADITCPFGKHLKKIYRIILN